MTQGDHDERFARLRAASERLTPPPGLSATLVRAALEPRRRSFAHFVLLSSRRALVIASIAAAASVALGLQMARALESTFVDRAVAGALGP